jgi:hypothetical protein
MSPAMTPEELAQMLKNTRELHDRRDEEYLGDGLYVSFDGIGFTLRTPRESGDHWVYLEPPACEAFARFIENCTRELRASNQSLRRR